MDVHLVFLVIGEDGRRTRIHETDEDVSEAATMIATVVDALCGPAADADRRGDFEKVVFTAWQELERIPGEPAPIDRDLPDGRTLRVGRRIV